MEYPSIEGGLLLREPPMEYPSIEGGLLLRERLGADGRHRQTRRVCRCLLL